MSKTVIFCEYQSKKVKKGTLELLSAAKQAGKSVMALAFGSDAKSICEELANFGAQDIFICEDEKLNTYNPQIYLEASTQMLKDLDFDTLLASSSSLTRDLIPRLAGKLSAAVASDCTELDLSSQTSVRRPLYSGKCMAKVNFSSSAKKFILMRPNQLPLIDPESGKTANIVTFDLPALELKTLIKEVVKGTTEKLDLTEANIIVSGGRGMKGPENFKLLEDLASVLGATVGASRAVCDAGWVPHSMQVGQTGKTVAPSLYIAVGISGAIQHLAGMTGSKVIVAINNDPDAPIFQKSTYGIVGDAFEVLPKLTEEFKKLVN